MKASIFRRGWTVLAIIWFLLPISARQVRSQNAQEVTPSVQCPSLSRKYVIQGEDGQVHISIEQQGCNRVTIARDSWYLGKLRSEKHVLQLDGIVRDDSAWLGSAGRHKTSAKFDGATLRVEVRVDGNMLTLIYSLTPERDLIEDSLLNGRRTGLPAVPLVGKRQK
jgi:hypothetical protein